MDDTDSDRAAIQPVINQVMVYQLSEYTGQMRSTDWSAAPAFPSGGESPGEQETRWVDPALFFDQLPEVMAEVPPLDGEEAWYAWLESVLRAAAADPRVAELLAAAAVERPAALVAELLQFRNVGLPLPGNWSTQRNGARFGTDYLTRTAIARSNIFVNTPDETAYFYQDLDAHGERLDGSRSYALTFPPHPPPPARPVRAFCPLPPYKDPTFSHANDLTRPPPAPKNPTRPPPAAGSLPLPASAPPPKDDDLRTNWLPAPDGPFSLFIRAYRPERPILDGPWAPPPVTRFH